jgi:hypothetical protein
VNRLNKTREEEYPDFSVLLSKREKELRRRERIQKEYENGCIDSINLSFYRYETKYQKEQIEEKRKEKKIHGNAYDTIMKEENMYSNKGHDFSRTAAEIEEDFM